MTRADSVPSRPDFDKYLEGAETTTKVQDKTMIDYTYIPPVNREEEFANWNEIAHTFVETVEFNCFLGRSTEVLIIIDEANYRILLRDMVST